MRRALALRVALCAALSAPAWFGAPSAQAVPEQAIVVGACGTQAYVAGTYRDVTQDTTGKACDGTLGFQQGVTGTAVAASNASSNTVLPGNTSDSTVVVYNPSANATAHVLLSTSAGATAVTTDTAVPPGAIEAFPRSRMTRIALILDSGSGTVTVWSGQGALNGFGGGGGGGSGGTTTAQGTYNATPLSLSDGQSAALQLGSHGQEKVCVSDTSGNCTDPTTPVPVVGSDAAQATATHAPLDQGCRTATQTPTLSTDGQVQYVMCGSEGKVITLPYAFKENWLYGAANTNANTATTLIAAQGASIKIYVTAIQCFRTDAGASLVYVTLNDSGATLIPIPAALQGGQLFPTPLTIAANTAFTFTASAATTTIYCTAQAYKGP